MEDIEGRFSDGELALVYNSISDNFRIDGRSCTDIREIKTETSILPGCNGSAKVESKNCSLTVGVKVEVSNPTIEEPNCGLFEINVNCSANANPKFEGRGGEDTGQDLAFILNNSILPTIDLTNLCISVGHKVWAIYVDVLVLECSCVGQLLDMSSIAIKAALCDTKIPKVIPDEEDPNDFIIANECDEYCPLDLNRLPILVTLILIGNKFVADVTEEEAAAGSARLTFAFDSTGQLLYSKKSGNGIMKFEYVDEGARMAQKLAIELHNNLNFQIECK